MKQLRIKTAKITSLPRENPPIMQALLYELPGNRGHVFALYRILGRKNKARERIAITINEHIERFKNSATEDMNLAHRFEQLLQVINEQLSSLSLEIRPIPITDVHAVVGIVSHQQIFLSGVGNLLAQFMHKTAKSRYTIYELDEQFEPPEKTSWEKLFITVLDGELNAGDIFYLAHRIPSRELSQNELQDILVTLPPSGALQRIQQYRGAQEVYGAICIKVKNPHTRTGMTKENPLTSIQQLGQTKEATAELIGDQKPSLVHSFQKITNPLLQKLSNPGNKGAKSVLLQIARFTLKASIVVLSFVWTALSKGSVRLWRACKELMENYAENKGSVKPTNLVSTIKNRVTCLPKAVKIGAISGICLVILAFLGIKVLSKSHSEKEALEVYTSIVQTIEEKRDVASASLIYDDTENARTLISEAAALLDTLSPPKNSENEIEGLRTELNQILVDLRGVSELSLSQVATIDSIVFDHFIYTNDQYYGISNGDLYQYNSLNSSFDPANLTDGSIGSGKEYTVVGDSIIFSDDQLQLGKIDIPSSTSAPIISGTNRLTSLSGLSIYLDNLYVLSPLAQQIIKMRPQGNGYEAGTSWISARESNINSGIDIEIDGDIFILLPDDIIRFGSGRELSLDLGKIDPHLSNAEDLWTNEDSSYLYILEPSASRIAVFDKTGAYVTQYVADELQYAVGFHMDESTNTGYVLTETTMYSFTISHLLAQ